MINPSDEIKAKLDIVEVIREYIPLKAAGYNFRALCPFHREKTPSFMVSPEKQIWHCFGCAKGGDVFSFVMEIEGLSFVETLRLLAKKAGIVLKKADPALVSKRNVLLDILELAAKFYHKVLIDSPAAESARRYLNERGLTDETIADWQIGYSPNAWDTLVNFLKARGFGDNEIFLAGLSVKRADLAEPAKAFKASGFYDRFRGRIMFPINDVNGNVVGFSARVSPEREAEEKMGKYINTPSTMIYDKSKVLFGLNKAKLAIKAEDAAVLVEGQMDAITAQQHGFKNVIATSGTALTDDQVNLIKRYSNNLYLSFDMDKAGDLAAERGIAKAMQAEMQIKVISIQGAKDPDECIRKNPDAWRAAVAAAKPMMQYYFEKTFAKYGKSDYEGQRQSVKALLTMIAKFGSKLEQDYWLRKLSQEVDANESSLREKLKEIISADSSRLARRPGEGQPAATGGTVKAAGRETGNLIQNREAKLSEMLLALALRFPAHLEYIVNHLSPEDLAGREGVGPVNSVSDLTVADDYRLFYKSLIIYYNKLIDFWTNEAGSFALSINYLDFKDWLIGQENPGQINQENRANDSREGNLRFASLLDRLVLLADKDFYDYSEEQAKAEIIKLITNLRIGNLTKRRRQIIKTIALTEKADAKPEEQAEKLKNLMEEFKSLSEEIKAINPED